MTPARSARAIATIAAAHAAAMVFGGCSSHAAAPAQRSYAPGTPAGYRRAWSDDDVAKPDWLANPTRGGTIVAASGSTPAEPGASHGLLRDRAMSEARSELARMVRVRVQSVLKDWLGDDGAGYGTFTESASRSLADQSVDGSYLRDEWTHPKTGELFVWVVVDPAFAKRMGQALADSARGGATGDPQRDAHLRAKAGSDAGFAELDRLLGKELGGR